MNLKYITSTYHRTTIYMFLFAVFFLFLVNFIFGNKEISSDNYDSIKNKITSMPHCDLGIVISKKAVENGSVSVPEFNNINRAFQECSNKVKNSSVKKDPLILKKETIHFIKNFKI